MGVVNSYIDHFTVRNTTNRPITLGDLVNVLVPAKKSIDLLKQPRVTKEKINQSHHLQIAVRNGWLVVSKPLKRLKATRERQATVSDEIYTDAIFLDDLIDVTISGVDDDDFLQYDEDLGKWVNRPPTEIDVNLKVITITSNYTALPLDDLILCNASSRNITVTLPTAVGRSGKRYYIKKIDTSTHTVTIDPNGNETMDSFSECIITSFNTCLTPASDGSNWFIL